MQLPKNYLEFSKTLEMELSESGWPETLKSLWHDAKGDWHTAHEIVDGMNDSTGKWIHAYLHRKESDEWNADYWYRQAGLTFPKISLDEEHREIVEFILSNPNTP